MAIGAIAKVSAKQLFLKEVTKFKKEFPVGFVQFFAGSTIDNIMAHAKGAIEGITTPIENELTDLRNDILGSEGLNDFIDALNNTLQDTINDFINDPNIALILLGGGYFLDKLATKIEGFLQDQIDILDLWALWAATLPAPPSPNDPVFVLPTPGIIWPDPYGWDPLDPDDQLIVDPWGDDDGIGWH